MSGYSLGLNKRKCVNILERLGSQLPELQGVKDAIEHGRLWKRQPGIPVSLLFQRIMEQTCDDDPVQPSKTE